jgi:hypothetical protein
VEIGKDRKGDRKAKHNVLFSAPAPVPLWSKQHCGQSGTVLVNTLRVCEALTRVPALFDAFKPMQRFTLQHLGVCAREDDSTLQSTRLQSRRQDLFKVHVVYSLRVRISSEYTCTYMVHTVRV